MTTSQTIDGVPRGRDALVLLVETFRDALHRGKQPTFSGGDLKFFIAEFCELRALLDADKCTSCDGSGDLIDLTGEWRGYCVCPAGVALKNKPAPQPQGGPVVDALSAGFYTTETGGGKYAINIGYRSMAEMQAADQQLRDLLRSRHAKPLAWYTEDYLTDKSATTYDLATMESWKAKGWPVAPLYAEQPAPVAVRMCDCNQGRMPCNGKCTPTS